MDPITDPVTFVVPGDLHLTEPGLANHRAALRVVDEVNELIRPDFVQFIGDNVQDATDAQYRLWDDLRCRLACRYYSLVGDHDVHAGRETRQFRLRFETTYGSTSLRGFRFLRLDTQEEKPVGMSAEQVEWFRAEVDAAPAAGERTVIFQHNYPYQIWETFDGTGIDEWRSIVQSRRITALLCGHTHYGQVANDGRNVAIAVRSIGDPEGGPPGYLVGHLAGDDFAIAYRSVEDRGPLLMMTHPREAILATGPAHVVAGRDRFEVRAWSGSAVESVRGRIDDSEWFALESAPSGRWIAPLPGPDLSKGRHRFEVHATDGQGVEAGRTFDFLVDPTGRYTAIPMTVPVVESTEFC